MAIPSNAVIVVSGGGRGITAQCVIRLAQQYGCIFLLLGRSSISRPEPEWAQGVIDEGELKKRALADLTARGEKPTPVRVQQVLGGLAARREIEATVAGVRAAGGQAEYLSVDITNADAVRAALIEAQTRLGTITGILHGAGNLADKLIENKTLDDFEYVYATKVDGLQALLSAVPPEQLQTLILFSSAAGFYGNVGQADYAIANEILNKTAYRFKQAYPQCSVLVLDWGPWDGGMVTPALKKLFAERGMQVIPVEVGTQILVDQLEAGENLQVLVGSPMGVMGKIYAGELRTHRLHRTLALNANPFLYDHTIGEHQVLPMVHALAWMANACEGRYPGYTFFSAENYKVLKGIVFNDELAERYTLDLTETEKNADQIVFDARISSTTPTGKPRFHYSARITLRSRIPPAPGYEKLDLSEGEMLDGAALYQNGTLFHGPTFQGVLRVLNHSQHNITLLCQSPLISEEQMGQFQVQTFNPFLADIQFQALVIWARLYYDAASLPLSARGGEQYRAIPTDAPFYVSMDVDSSSESALVATITAHDAEGRIYTRVRGAEVTLSKQLNRLFSRHS